MSYSDRPRILAVDDEVQNLELMERGLSLDWELHCETGAAGALKRVHKHSYSAIVTDLRMPGMDGAEFVRRVQAVDPEVVCVLVTGYGDLPEVRVLKEQGAVCRVIIKPWDIDELRSAIAAAARFTCMRRTVAKMRPASHR